MPHPSQQAVVAQARQDLLNAGVDLSGACGAWRITNLAAWRLQDGAGLLAKPAGNNCEGYAVDILAYPDGAIYDVLIASGLLNDPAWQEGVSVDPSRWRPAIVPTYYSGTPPLPTPPPPLPTPPPPTSDLAARVTALEARMARVEGWTAQAPR
jgi:hypothetical protein